MNATLIRILGAAAAVAATGAAVLALDKLLNDKGPLQVEKVEFPEKAEDDKEEAEATAAAYAEGEAKQAEAADHTHWDDLKPADAAPAPAEEEAAPAEEAAPEAPAEPETPAEEPAPEAPAEPEAPAAE